MRGTFINKIIFNAGSTAYDVLTGHSVWYEQAGEVIDFIEQPAGINNILDLGCGPGTSAFALAKLFPDATVDGIDLADRMIARAKRHHAEEFAHLSRLRFHSGDAEDLPWPDDSFDLVVGHSFLYLVPDRLAVLAQAFRVLRPGGTLILLEPKRTGSFRDAATQSFGRDFASHSGITVARFGASMVAWRIVSGNIGRLDPEDVMTWLADTGFNRVETVDALGGLGMHCIGHKPG